MLKRVVTISLAFTLIGLAGCAELKDLRKQNASLADQVTSLQSEKGTLLEENRALQALRDSVQAALTKAIEDAKHNAAIADELRRAKAEAERVALEMKQLLKDVEDILTVKQGPDGTSIVMDSNVFFASGKDELNADASTSLDRLVTYLLDNPDQEVRIDGHTDGVPITHSAWKDNYHLGAMRALAVMRYLTDKGLDASRVHIVSYGPNRPAVVPDEPTADLPANRRVEILLVPKTTLSPAEILGRFGE